MTTGYHFLDIEHSGYTFRATQHNDDHHPAPWTWADGHGVVSDWTARDKRPGERVLHQDGRARRYYDVQATMQIAKRDGWGLSDKALAVLAEHLGRTLTAGEIAAEAVALDFEYLRGWCNDQWCYVGVVVELLDEDGDPVAHVSDSLWGIESNADDYLREAAEELAAGLAHGLVKEANERRYWAERDVVTA